MLKIHNKDEVYVKIECNDGVAWELRDEFSFMVPGAQYSPQFRARLWDGKIRLFNVNTRQIYRGLVPYIIKFCEERNYAWEYDNEVYDTEFSVKEANEFIDSLKIDLERRDYQVDAFVKAIRNRRMLMLSPTASGKSFIIYLILKYLYDKKYIQNALIVVPTTSLVSQLKSDFTSYGLDADAMIHTIMAGKAKQTDMPFVISTWQSVYEQGPAYFKKFDCVIGDEAHLFKAKSLCSIMEKAVNAKYRIGTTGTLDGTKTHKLVLEGLFGTEEKITTTKQLMDKKYVADFEIKCLVLKHNKSVCQAAKKFSYADEIEYLVLNESRNKFISNLALSLKGNTLVLYQYVEKHGAILHEMIQKLNTDKKRKIFFVHGGTETEDRENIRHIVDSHPLKTKITLHFDETKIECDGEENVMLTNQTSKKAKNITENDDIDTSWILNKSKSIQQG